MENKRLDHKKREVKSTESPQDDMWTSAFDRKDGANLADPPPLQLEATHTGTGDETYKRVLLVLGISPEDTGLPEGELQLLAAMLQRLPIDGVTKAREDGSIELRLQQADATLSLHITRTPDGGQPLAEIDFRHGKHVLRRSVDTSPSATGVHDRESDGLEVANTESGMIQIVGIGDNSYIEGKGGISVSEEYLEEFTHTKPIGQEGGVGLSDPHIGYSRKVQVTAEDGRKIYVKVYARAAKAAGASSLTTAPNEASFELLVTRQDGQQGYLSGEFADVEGTMNLPEMLAALAKANDFPFALLTQGQLGEPFIDDALSKADGVLAALPQANTESAGRLGSPEELTRVDNKQPWEQMSAEDRQLEAAQEFWKEFSWARVVSYVAIGVAAIVAIIVLAQYAPMATSVILGLIALAAIGLGIYTIAAPYLAGEHPGWVDWLKGGLLIVGGVAGLAALLAAAPEILAAAEAVAFAAGIAYVIVEIISSIVAFAEGAAAPTREKMLEKVKESAHEAEHGIADGITAAIPIKLVKQVVSKMKAAKPGVPGEEFLPTEELGPKTAEEEVLPNEPEIAATEKKGSSLVPSTQLDATYLLQKGIVQEVTEGKVLLNSTGRKGNFGEMATDVDMVEKGWTPEHRRITDIDAKTETGIDHVFSKGGPPKITLVVDSKFGSAKLSTLADGTRQMSGRWIENRLRLAVGREKADDILSTGYTSVVAKVNGQGTFEYKLLDANGYVLGSFIP